MLAGHRGKTEEEIIDRVAGFDIVEQGLHGHARTGEYRSSTHDIRRSADDRCAHMVKVKWPAVQSRRRRYTVYPFSPRLHWGKSSGFGRFACESGGDYLRAYPTPRDRTPCVPRCAANFSSPSVPMTGAPHCTAALRPARSSISTAAAWISRARQMASSSPTSTFSEESREQGFCTNTQAGSDLAHLR